MLNADVVVVQCLRFAQRQLQGLLGARRERDMAAGSGPSRNGTLRERACRQWGVAASTTAMSAARQLGQRALPPCWPSALAGGREGPGEGVRAERRFDPGADDVEVDADGSQRLAVEAA